MRLAHPTAVLALLASVVTGCASTVNGSGTVVSSPSSSPTSGSFPSSSSASSSGPSTSSASGSSSTSSSTSCSPGFCDDFSSTSSGWPRDHQPHYYGDYDNSLGGTYHMGERTAAYVSEDAPVKISSFSPDYGVRAEVDAVLGPSMKTGTAGGFTCWEHESSDHQSYSAFLFTISDTTAEVGVWRETDGKYFSIQSVPSTDLQGHNRVNHLSITCTRTSSGAGDVANLTMTVNGNELIRASYATGGGSQPWKVGDGLGLVAGGIGSDVFYDNFRMVPAS